MKMRLNLFLYSFCVILFYSNSAEAKRAGNRPYVQAFPDGGIFYARCLPDENEGDKGTTEILRVHKDGDKSIDKYEWYNKYGLHLGWSPIVGKVAVMRFRQDEGKEFDKQIELSFYIGGKLLKSYTTADLVKLGARTARSSADLGPRALYKPIACKQVPSTNDYYFGIDFGNGTILRFNVLNGKLCRLVEEKQTVTRPNGSIINRTKYSLIDITQESNNEDASNSDSAVAKPE